jgi:hypothetical protein
MSYDLFKSPLNLRRFVARKFVGAFHWITSQNGS